MKKKKGTATFAIKIGYQLTVWYTNNKKSYRKGTLKMFYKPHAQKKLI